MSKFLPGLMLCLVGTLSVSSFAQEKKVPNPAPSCNRESALAILEEQIATTKTFDDEVKSVAVLIRAADLMWPEHQEKARAVFGNALRTCETALQG